MAITVYDRRSADTKLVGYLPAVKFSFHFQTVDNQDGHHDLVLDFADQSFSCDSYYLALDHGLLPRREDLEKVRHVLVRLLEQWADALASMNEEEIVYLPYDFSDQYTGWIRCLRLGEFIEMSRGWAPIEGWAVSPSSLGPLVTGLVGFQKNGPMVTTTRQDLRDAINESIQAVCPRVD